MLQKYESGQLVPASRTLFVNLTDEILVKWYKPQRRTIIMGSGIAYHLPFPYMVFIRIHEMLRVVMTLESPTLMSPVYICPLGNMFLPELSVCLSNFEDEETFENMIRYFWNSEFDFDSWYTQYIPYSKWSAIKDVLNSEHWIEHLEFEERFYRKNFVWWLGDKKYKSDILNKRFSQMYKYKTLEDALILFD